MAGVGCSITSELEIVSGVAGDYAQLGQFHYRDTKLSPYAAMYAIVEKNLARKRFGSVAGVIVYQMPCAVLELRNVATRGVFSGMGDKAMQLQMVNNNIRCISRVIIEPRYRGLGLAGRLVRETMGKLNAPIIEAMAVMGQINPFFEKAGMQSYSGQTPVRCAKLVEALSMVGIEGRDLVDSKMVQSRLDSLSEVESVFIEKQFGVFLQCYGRRKQMKRGLERTRYILSKLTGRPVYYIWFNPEMLDDGKFKVQLEKQKKNFR